MFLSVGGSPQPLLSSLREVCPDHAVFVVSDGCDGSHSSQVTASELLQAEGCPGNHTFLSVPPDDIDGALARIEPELSKALARSASVTVDYTGGTKSMTSAMVLAATLHEGVCLQFMAGARTGLRHVEDGTEKPAVIPTELIGLSQTFRIVRKFIGLRNYGAALSVLREIDGTFICLRGKAPRAWRKKVGEWKKWVAIFDHWDRFDHADAWRHLQNGLESGAPHATWFKGDGVVFQARLRKLTDSRGCPSYVLLEDLWMNAERRARLGLYDDAVARLYRLMEAAVQTRLWNAHRIKTDKVPFERLPESLREKFCHRGQPASVNLALSDAIDLLGFLDPEDPLSKINEHGYPKWQSGRNNSILAHGFRPLEKNDWQQARSWFLERTEFLCKGRRGWQSADQLPDQLPNF